MLYVAWIFTEADVAYNDRLSFVQWCICVHCIVVIGLWLQVEPLDEVSLKKLLLQFEKRLYRNQELRIKFPDMPEK